MPSYLRPGVYAEEVLNPSSAISSPSSGIAAFMAAHGRGPAVPTLIESWTQYLNLFGGFGASNQYLPFALHSYFTNGGRAAYVNRILGTGAIKATRTLMDRAGAPIATLRVDALNEGTWANALYVDITDLGLDRFNLTVKFGGTSDAFVVERWADLSMVDSDSRYAPSIINSLTAGSTYISVVDLASATVAPADRPALGTSLVLAGGVDGAAPTVGQQQAAISLLDPVDGPLTINLPGVYDTAVVATALSYAEARGDSFVVIDSQDGRTAAQLVAYANTFTSAYGAVYGPWVYVSDPSSSSPGALKKVPPGSAVAGIYARTDTLRGVHKAPAGTDARIAGAVAIETKFTNTELDTLNSGLVNAIRHLPGIGIAVFGARTCRNTAADRYVPTRRTLSYIRKALVDGTRWAVFEPNDRALWAGINSTLTQFLLRMWQQGALRGGSAREAFYVKCDSENNTPASIQAGTVNIEVGVALQFPAEFVVIRIGQWEGGASAVESR